MCLSQWLQEAGPHSSAWILCFRTSTPAMCQLCSSAQQLLEADGHPRQPAEAPHAALRRSAGAGGAATCQRSASAALGRCQVQNPVQCVVETMLTGVALEHAGHSSERRRRTERDQRINHCCQLLRQNGLSCYRCRPSVHACCVMAAGSKHCRGSCQSACLRIRDDSCRRPLTARSRQEGARCRPWHSVSADSHFVGELDWLRMMAC
jgi:hypothetical protein